MGILSSKAKEALKSAKESAKEVMTTATDAVAVGSSVVLKGAAETLKTATKGVASVGTGVKSVGDTLEKVFGDSEERHLIQEKRYISKQSGRKHLFVQRYEKKEDAFILYDVEGHAQYSCIANINNKKKVFSFSFYNNENQQIAYVFRTNSSSRNRLFHEENPADYIVQIGEEQVANLHTVLNEKKQPYEVDPYCWVVKQDAIKWDFSFMEGKKVLVHISKRKGYEKETYIVDYDNNGSELLYLLLAMTLICIEAK